jgi:hypothetical protein
MRTSPQVTGRILLVHPTGHPNPDCRHDQKRTDLLSGQEATGDRTSWRPRYPLTQPRVVVDPERLVA